MRMAQDIMDIMDMPKMKGTETKKGYEITPEYFLVIALLSGSQVYAADIELDASLSTEGIAQNVKRNNDTDLSLQTITVTPHYQQLFKVEKLLPIFQLHTLT